MLFQILCVILLVSFYGCYFIKMFSQKKKGIRTDQLGKGKTGFVKWIEIILKVDTIVVPVVEVGSIGISTSLLPLWARWVGVAVASFGTAVFIISVVTMRDSWRAGVSKSEKTALVTDGIYQISRNPAFLGFDLVYAGICLMFFNWWLFAISLFAALVFHLQIVNVEEEFLNETFGAEYTDYRKKVCRYLGRRN